MGQAAALGPESEFLARWLPCPPLLIFHIQHHKQSSALQHLPSQFSSTPVAISCSLNWIPNGSLLQNAARKHCKPTTNCSSLLFQVQRQTASIQSSSHLLLNLQQLQTFYLQNDAPWFILLAFPNDVFLSLSLN